MQSLRDKNNRKSTRNRMLITFGIVFVVLVLGAFIIPRLGGAGRATAKPLWNITDNMSANLQSFFANFRSKRALQAENQSLKNKLAEINARLTDNDALASENTSLKELLGRDTKEHFILATVLVKPSHSLYDTLIIDIGSKLGVAVGNIVYAYGTIPIGTISNTATNTSTVTLFSTAGQQTTGRVLGSNIDIELVGRGGGNFEVKIPRDVVLAQNTEILLPGLQPKVIAVVAKSITDSRDPSQTFLLTSPVNINELNSVEVVK
jgi:cell shape-determining protein MreC